MVGGLNRIAVVGEGGDGLAVDPIALSGYVQEVLTHGWDLAPGHRPAQLDPELASWVLAVAQRILPPEPRGEIPFGPVLPVSPTPPGTSLAGMHYSKY